MAVGAFEWNSCAATCYTSGVHDFLAAGVAAGVGVAGVGGGAKLAGWKGLCALGGGVCELVAVSALGGGVVDNHFVTPAGVREEVDSGREVFSVLGEDCDDH